MITNLPLTMHHHSLARFVTLFFLLPTFVACNDQRQTTSVSSAQESPTQNPEAASANEDSSDTLTLRLLFLGNSHTGTHDVPDKVANLFVLAGLERPDVQAYYGAFLDDLEARADVVQAVDSGAFDFVILQGQKISMSGRYRYSTESAVKLASRARASNTTVVWFAEWAREGVAGEKERIQRIYEGLSDPRDLVAPTGYVWDAVLSDSPGLALHSSDKNHANEAGATLAAITLFATVCGPDWLSLQKQQSVQPFDESQTAAAFLRIAQQLSMQEVIAADHQYGLLRDLASKSMPLGQAITQYVEAMRQVGFPKSQPRFSKAYASHIEAWEKSIPFFAEFSELRGERDQLFDELRRRTGDTQRQLERHETAILETWRAVENARTLP